MIPNKRYPAECVKFTNKIIQKLFRLTDSDIITLETTLNKEVTTVITINHISIDIILSNCDDIRVLFMMLPKKHFKNLLDTAPTFKEYYNNLADDAFVNECNYIKNDLQKAINDDTNADDTFVNIYFDAQSYDLVTSIFTDTSYSSEQNISTIYYWSLFTNPKYYRHGYAESLIRLITSSNICLLNCVKKELSINNIIFIATSYVWNTSSINLFTKLGYICSHAIIPSTSPKNKSTLQKYTYNNIEYTEDVMLHFIYNPSSNADTTGNTCYNTEDNTELNTQNTEYTIIEKLNENL